MLWYPRQPYTTYTFAQIWPEFSDFSDDYNDLIAGFLDNPAPVSSNSVSTIYYLLVAKYGNNPISNSDPDQFKMKVMSIIYQYGPVWEKKQEIQATLRSLTETELLTGAKQIYNHALNPSSEPSTSSLEELTYINEQNTTSNKKAKMEAYSILWNLLYAEATREFISKFKSCFAVFVDKMAVPFYIDNDDTEEEEN